MADITIQRVVNAQGHPVEIKAGNAAVVEVDSSSSEALASINWEEV